MISEYKEIFVTEGGGLNRNQEVVCVGVPFAKGYLPDSSRLQLLNAENERQPVQSTVLATWPDGSVKWLLLDFAATVSAHSRAVYRLVQQNGETPLVASPVHISRGTDAWHVSTGTAEFVVDTKQFRPFIKVVAQDKEIFSSGDASCLLGLVGGNLTPSVDTIVAETEGPLRTILRLEGWFGTNQPSAPRFLCRLHFFAARSCVLIELTLSNPRAACHPGGFWDLGDSGSLLFKELALQFPLAGAGSNKIVCYSDQNTGLMQFEPSSHGMMIYQESSGGEHWDSPVHRTRDGNVHLRFPGYAIYDKGEQISGGRRATPLVWCGTGALGVAAVMPNFWQEFPKALAVDSNGLKVAIFPACAADLHELQGGEQKTTSIYLDFAAAPESLAWARSPLVAAPAPETCRLSTVFADFPETSDTSTFPDLIDNFITPEDLLKQREIIDEYGWRNFGEMYADHEASKALEDKLFVSHYNNQYDITAGLYRKFLATGDYKWGVLATDLVRHVLDVDIYHTSCDREEYNQGLFWHTDHYVDAGLATHRSFSKEHVQGKDARYCGGGPGAEHCYTTGLMYHYFQTGNPSFKNAVIALAEWALIALAGPPTLLEILRKSALYLKMLQRRTEGQQVLFPRYPFTRGTGNTIIACLDAFEVGGGESFLNKAELLIRGALSPQDDIQARNLADIEATWSYTVLMVAIGKFLYKKQEVLQCDDGYFYAMECLLHYAEWMLEHEYFYLDKPDILEYPNETWAAQDLRKSVIFYYAAFHVHPQLRADFIKHARYFYDRAKSELSRHKTSRYVRPVALVLQNGWVDAALSKVDLHGQLPVEQEKRTVHSLPSPHLCLGTVINRLIKDLPIALRETSLAREIAWLKVRISK